MSDDDGAGTISLGQPDLGWVAVAMRTHVAVVPVHEDGHVLDLACWCGPTVESPPECKQALVTHRDLGEREGLGELTAEP